MVQKVRSTNTVQPVPLTPARSDAKSNGPTPKAQKAERKKRKRLGGLWSSSILQNADKMFKKMKTVKCMRVSSTKTTESQVRVTRSIARLHRMKMVVDQFSLSKLQRLSEVLRRQESSAYLRHIGRGKFANVYKVSNASGSSEHHITAIQHNTHAKK